MQNIKLTVGMVLVVVTSVQVKGMHKNTNLTDKQKNMILQLQIDNIKDINYIDEKINSIRANEYMPTANKFDRIYELEDEKKVFTKKNKKLDEIVNSNKEYDDNQIKQTQTTYYSTKK